MSIRKQGDEYIITIFTTGQEGSAHSVGKMVRQLLMEWSIIVGNIEGD